MARLVVLECEDVRLRECQEAERLALREARKSGVLVVPWTTRDPNKERKCREIIGEYFAYLGASVASLERGWSPARIESEFEAAGVLYLPGGDPLVLLEEVEESGVGELVRSFEGVIVGNSAGALVISESFVASRGLCKGLGVVEACLAVHYVPGDRVVLSLSHRRGVVALTEGSALAIRGREVEEVWGDVYRISGGVAVRLKPRQLLTE